MKVKTNQSSDKTAPPQPPSPGSDGEDKPEESYWTRFKKWCSEHSLAIGLGITLVAATLIYIYREDISQLINGVKPPEEKKEEETGKTEDSSQATSQESSKTPLTATQEMKTKAEDLAKEKCKEVFFFEGEKINGTTFNRKSMAFSQSLREMEEYYKTKKNPSQRKDVCELNIAFFKEEFQTIYIHTKPSIKSLLKSAKFVNEQLAKSPEERTNLFTHDLAFLTGDKDFPNSAQLLEQWFGLMYLYMLDRLEDSSGEATD